MRAVVTRVKNASVTIDNAVHGAIERGFLVLLGIHVDDGPEQVQKLVDKITGLRIFEDDAGKMNLSLSDVGGSLLVISQFTLYGNCKKGRRPEFLSAARPETAIPLYEQFVSECKNRGFTVETGAFGAYMQVASVNDGPVTLILDTENL